MNMADDVTSVTLQIVQRGADVAAHTAKELLDALMRLFAELGRSRGHGGNDAVNSTDLTNIKTGGVKMDTLRANAKSLGDTLSMSENALTKEDMRLIA